jgi:hypothetical protein
MIQLELVILVLQNVPLAQMTKIIVYPAQAQG